jgi:transcriptional regulator with XRE-family HTH domain
MRGKNLLVRLFRAVSGLTQKDFGQRTGVHPILVARYELDEIEPGPEGMDRLAAGAGLTVAAGEEILRVVDSLRRPRRRAGEGAEDLEAQVAAVVSSVYQRLLRLPLPHSTSAEESWALLEPLSKSERSAVVRVSRQFQSWALLERVRAESEAQAPRDSGYAASLDRLAQEITDRVREPEGVQP